nr:cytochrome P450 4V2-like [Dermacentor andersoni]
MEPVPPLYKPLLHSRIVSACVSVAVIAVLFYCARMLTRTIRAYACLWNIPHPYERFPFCLLLDLWQRVASMDSSLEVPAKIFNYLDSVFYQIHDQDVTVAFYGPKPFLIAVTPDTVERVLSSTENVNKSFLYAMLKSWVGNGLLTSEKAIWKTRRKVLTPAFHFRILDEYVPIMNRRAALLCDKLAALGRDHFDVLPVMRIATFGILFETAMGIKLDEEDVKKTGFLKVNDEIATAIVTRMMNIHHWPEFIYKRTEVGRKFYEKVELIKKYTRDILSCRKKTYNIEGGEAVQKKSFMDILLRMHMEEGIFTEEEIREEVNTFMIGGFDTTATAASFAMHLLGNHPEAQSKVHEELDAVFGSDRERPVTREDIAQLKYLDCVIKETLRLYPPIPAIARKLGEDLILGKHTIPKGTVTIIFIYFMHRHPRFVPKPNDFTPERFLEFDKERHPFLYIPFAGGARNCIGQKFAQLEDKILLAQILRRFKVESKTRSEDLQMSLELVLRPTQGLHIKLTPRNHAIMRKRKEALKAKGAEKDYTGSFLDILLQMHLEDGSITEEEVLDETVTIFAAGYDTTAALASYCLYLLGNYRDVQVALHNEIDRIFGDDVHRPVTTDDLRSMRYLSCIIKETLRLYPSVPIMGRYIEEDMKIGTQLIPKGTMALVLIYFLHRHPRFHKNPSCFTPERFLSEVSRPPQYAYMPFFGGPRNCIGISTLFHLAALETNNEFFNYIGDVISKIHEEEVTIAYYGPQPFLLGISPTVFEHAVQDQESLRLYPPVPLIARNIDEDVHIGKHTIPKGTVAVCAIYFLHRHPNVYKEPNAFMPERFMETENVSPFAYVPFSAGSRNCIGQRFAQLEEKIMLAHILRNFSVESLVPKEELQLQLEIVLRPLQGIQLKLTPRQCRSHH